MERLTPVVIGSMFDVGVQHHAPLGAKRRFCAIGKLREDVPATAHFLSLPSEFHCTATVPGFNDNENIGKFQTVCGDIIAENCVRKFSCPRIKCGLAYSVRQELETKLQSWTEDLPEDLRFENAGHQNSDPHAKSEFASYFYSLQMMLYRPLMHEAEIKRDSARKQEFNRHRVNLCIQAALQITELMPTTCCPNASDADPALAVGSTLCVPGRHGFAS